jgi:amino acid transporter
MNGRTIWRAVLGVVLVALLVGVAAQVYEVGVAQGVAQGAQVAAAQPGVAQPGVAPYPYYGYGPFYRPWGFGFGFLHLLFPILFLLLIFGVLRGLFWGGRHRWGGHNGGDWSQRVPPMFEDWHRRAHEGQQEPRQGEATAT